MEFGPEFSLLAKFTTGLGETNPSGDETSKAAAYLGLDLPHTSLVDRIQIVSNELERQNGVLAEEIEYDTIMESDDYHKSLFIREVVANNRANR